MRFLLLCTVLAGCGGSGSSGSLLQSLDYDAFEADVVAPGVTPVSFVPTSGTHDYAGFMQLNLPLGEIPAQLYQGQFEISLTFDNVSVAASGNADGFINENGNELAGDLTFGGGLLVITADPDRDFLLFADIDGQLTDAGTSYDLSARVAADLYGTEATGLAGRVFSGAISDGTSLDIFDGTFAGEKVP